MPRASKDDAWRAESEGRWRDAMAAFAQLAKESGNPLFLVLSAGAADKGGFAQEAESILKDAIARYPACAEAYSKLGFVLNDADRLEEARAMFVAALAIRESQPDLTLLGLVERDLGHRDAALAALRRSLELAPDDDEAHHILGITLMDDEPLEAIAHFERAHEIDPDLPHVLREWGRALWRAKRMDEALDKLRRALSFDPDDAWAHCYLGNLLLESEPKEARSSFQRAVSLEPRHGFFWGNLGYAHQELGERSEAEKCFRKGLSVEFDSPYLHRRYGLFLKRVGKLQKAKRYLKRALELDPMDEKVRAALAELE